MIPLIPMSELVRDPAYKRFLETKPELPPVARSKAMMSSPPWVVYIQRDAGGKWGKREFWKYSEAFRFMARALKLGVHDAALNCKRYGFEPPMRFVRIKGKFVTGSDGKQRQATKAVPWKPKLEGTDEEHHWCKYCRRPTVFKFYRKHKRLPLVDSTVPRCCICGASARIALSDTDRMFRIH
jgi:hypothetical protein